MVASSRNIFEYPEIIQVPGSSQASKPHHWLEVSLWHSVMHNCPVISHVATRTSAMCIPAIRAAGKGR